MEFVKEPVKAQAEGGWSAKTGDIYEDVEITSFKLRSLSAAITHTGGEKSLTGGPGHQIFVVMKDGTQVEVFGYNGQIYKLMSPIDLTQVDHVLLADGTKLPA